MYRDTHGTQIWFQNWRKIEMVISIWHTSHSQSKLRWLCAGQCVTVSCDSHICSVIEEVQLWLWHCLCISCVYLSNLGQYSGTEWPLLTTCNHNRQAQPPVGISRISCICLEYGASGAGKFDPWPVHLPDDLSLNLRQSVSFPRRCHSKLVNNETNFWSVVAGQTETEQTPCGVVCVWRSAGHVTSRIDFAP